MNLKEFKSGTYRQEYQYKSFLPNKINHTFTWDDPQINTMLESATRALGELNAFTMIVPNVDIFIQMHITKEANTSSKIEGTKTEIDEVLISKEHLSDFIEQNKTAYYEALTIVRMNNDLAHWIKFFLEAVISTANSGIKTFQQILDLKKQMDAMVIGFGRKAHNTSKLIDYLYQKPIIYVGYIIKPLEITKQTANQIVKEFETKGILKEITGYERNKLFVFEKYINIYSQS